MELKQIEERIEKKQAQIAKIEKRIAKWTKAKSDEAFKKEYSWLAEGGLYYNQLTGKYDVPYEQFKADRFEHYIENCDVEIKRANNDLADAALTIQKYNNMLKLEQAKQDKLSADRIQVIVDFLEAWKGNVTKYIHENVKVVKKYFEVNSKCCELHNNHYWLIKNGTYASEEEFKEAYKTANEEQKMLRMMMNDLAYSVYDRNAKNLTDDKRLKEILDKEADDKYIKMVDSITEKVGEITDASELNVGPKGDLEGRITGTKGKAHVWTVGAGGYNENVVLESGRHGQCYHFRTLVRSVRG